MLLLTADDLAGAVVINVARTEERLGIIGTVRCKLLQVVMQFLINVLEVDFLFNVECWV